MLFLSLLFKKIIKYFYQIRDLFLCNKSKRALVDRPSLTSANERIESIYSNPLTGSAPPSNRISLLIRTIYFLQSIPFISKALISNSNLTEGTESIADITNQTTVVADVFVFLDTTWQYNRVVDYIK